MDSTTTRVCRNCGLDKPIDDFHRDRSRPLGRAYECKACKCAAVAAYRATYDREKAAEYNRAYRLENKERIAARAKERMTQPEARARRRKYMREWAKSRRQDPRHHLDGTFSALIRQALYKGKRGYSWESVVGYTLDDLMQHLESLFRPGMTWDNYGRGGWHIDHIVPRSHFFYTTHDDDDFSRCWSLSNLQPLWEAENCSKQDRYIG